MTLDPSAQPGAFSERTPISHEDVLKLRAQIWSDGSVTPQEASQLFDMNDAAGSSAEWSDFFVEAMCDFLIARGQPCGYINPADADWLIHHIKRDGRLDHYVELELVVKLLERADYAPESLKAFALSEIERAVLTGSGPTRTGGEIEPGRIDDVEVKLLRRLIFAPAGDGPAHVSQAEAELLFRIKDATLSANNSPEWKRLFVQGVANHLMGHQPHTASPEAAARFEKPYQSDVFGHVLSKLGRDRAGFEEAAGEVFGDDEAKRIAAHDAEVAREAQVTRQEGAWLQTLFDRSREKDELEQALIDFLAEDGIRPF